MKKKRFMKGLIFATFLFFGLILTSKAQYSANTDGRRGYTGYTGSTCPVGVVCGLQDAHRIKVRLVYYDGQRETIIAGPTMVEPDQWGWYTIGESYSFNSSNFEKSTVGSNSAPKEQRRQALQNFIRRVGWNVNLDSLTKYSCAVDRKGNCYGKPGYRVIAELYVGLASYSGAGVGDNFVTVKGIDAAATDLNWHGRSDEMSNKMSIVWSDINYRCNSGTGVCNNSGQSTSCLVDRNCGYGIWIVDISAALNPYDYSLDMACENCDSKNADNKAIVIQDTTNWKYINASKDVQCTNSKSKAKDYFYKSGYNGVYCREEFHAYLPNNRTGKLNVETGRFFTVNASTAEREKLPVLDVPDLGPIKVTRIRECRGGDAELNKFRDNTKNDFSNNVGTIKMKYQEKGKTASEYTLAKRGSWDNRDLGIAKNGVLKQSVTWSFTLPLNKNRYVEKNGSLVDAATSSTKDLGIGAIPVSFDFNYKAGEQFGTVAFEYKLPTGDKNSLMHKAYGEKNNYFSECGKVNENSYKKPTNDEPLVNSACYKLYKTKTERDKCVNERKTNKMGNCVTANSITAKAQQCIVAIPDCTCETAGKGAWKDYTCNPKENTCCPPNQPYNEETGKCGKCTDKTAGKEEWEGYTWNPQTGKCCPPGTPYNSETQKCEVPVCNETTANTKGPGYDFTDKKWDSTVKECCSKTLWHPYKDSEPDGPGTCTGKPKACNQSTAGKKTANYDFTDQKYSTKEGKCCNIKDYDSKTDTCDKNICNADNYQAKGRSWNENKGECCPIGYVYDKSLKDCKPSSCEYKICKSGVCCEGKDGPFCGEKIGEVKLCPGKPKCTGDCESVTSLTTYRTVDLGSPFSAQGGGTRDTGTNWCYNNDGSYKCDGNNDLVTTIIDNTNNNEADALYKVKLDSKAISQIRAYNSKTSYDDNSLECKNGENCVSTFIHEEIQDLVTGKCANANTPSKLENCK